MEPKTIQSRRRLDDYTMPLVGAIATVMKASTIAEGRPLSPCPVAIPGWQQAGAPWTLVQHATAPGWELIRHENGTKLTSFRWASSIDDAARKMLDFDRVRPLVEADVVWLTELGQKVVDGVDVALTPEGLAALAHA